jgi:Endonuclease/Exonuclease/phosphatase family
MEDVHSAPDPARDSVASCLGIDKSSATGHSCSRAPGLRLLRALGISVSVIAGCAAGGQAPEQRPVRSASAAPPPEMPITTSSASSGCCAEERRAAVNEATLRAVDVPGFESALLYSPAGTSVRPLLVATHGAGGEPDWDCEYWRRLTLGRAFVLCLRGTSLGSQGGFYYRDHHALGRELDAAERIARSLDPRIAAGSGLYAGFSQGATMGSALVPARGRAFPFVVLIEGFELWNVPRARAFGAVGGQAVLLACGSKECAKVAAQSAHWIESAGLRARLEYAAGAGHTPQGQVLRKVEAALPWLVSNDPLWRAVVSAPTPEALEKKAASGKLSLVTYNVAGLPEAVSHLRPVANLPVVGRLLNQYDVALVQEDYAYPNDLRRFITLPYRTDGFVRGKRIDFGDGMSEFSRLPFAQFEREAWNACNGYVDAYFDCWTPKGLAFARHELATGVTVDVYDVHLDAGGAPGDRAAREAQMLQLSAAIELHSAGHAVILGGDTNIREDQSALLERFERETGLVNVCDALRCPDPGRIDRVFYRNAGGVSFRPLIWRTDARFVDRLGRPLSDHLPVAVTFEWHAP